MEGQVPQDQTLL